MRPSAGRPAPFSEGEGYGPVSQPSTAIIQPGTQNPAGSVASPVANVSPFIYRHPSVLVSSLAKDMQGRPHTDARLQLRRLR
jgi:hypothetical protein